jgi:hypothetical protein
MMMKSNDYINDNIIFINKKIISKFEEKKINRIIINIYIYLVVNIILFLQIYLI